jgi:hypothetical protein
MPLPDALPYGVRDLKVTPYLDAIGSQLATVSIDLPNMQTLTFRETEEFQDLRGDDRIVATRGRGAQVEWDLEAGGMSPQVWAVFTGAEVLETGTTPNIKVLIRKKGSDSRPYFRIEGQSISDSGGDVRVKIYRARCNGNIEGEFKDGEFFITKGSGLGLPLLDDQNDLLYDIEQNEEKTSISLTPDPNPLPTPQNIEVGVVADTTVALSWDEVTDADSYMVQRAVSPYTAWVAVASGAGGEPTTASTTVTGLTTATAYKFRVAAVIDAVVTDYSTPTGVVTTA